MISLAGSRVIESISLSFWGGVSSQLGTTDETIALPSASVLQNANFFPILQHDVFDMGPA